MVDGTPMPLKILNYVKEKSVSFTNFRPTIIFFIHAETINPTEVNTLFGWFCVCVTAFIFLVIILKFFCC